jgi:hypothetical protein
MTIKHTVSSLLAAGLFAAGGTALAGDASQSFGRDGGAMRWAQGAPVTASDTQQAQHSNFDAAGLYGRAGRVSGLEGGPRDVSDAGTMPQWPGRQGRAMSIDEVRG